MKKIVITIIILLVVYLGLGSLSFVSEPKRKLPKLAVTSVADNNNAAVDVDVIQPSLSEQEGAIVDKYFASGILSSELKTIIDHNSKQLSQFSKTLNKKSWFNKSIPENGVVTPDLKFPNLANTRTLSRLFLVQTKIAYNEKNISSSEYKTRLQRLYNFGQMIENGSYPFIEFLVGKSIKAVATDQANKDSITLTMVPISKETKQRILLSEFTMINSALEQSRKQFDTGIDKSAEKNPWTTSIPFLFKPHNTQKKILELFFASKNAINTDQCDSIPKMKVHWYDWLLPNSVGKRFARDLVVIPDTLCREK